ncbi:E3 SUMO-protein ligase KIAA1586-like [Olea europaea var. sylvestris]|uniref:E3 SUMO-protein ligase KIAA1586-like n=1 Tax=Olea europaea var. sylvestris TaxID=158386 RepID=UPI000C1D099F|nr:E3 SUMO-protein ligase KIAA1586-like [Olea europaea var. sylvestris]
MNIEVGKIVLGNAPKNATYMSPDVKKEILSIMANTTRQGIRIEIGDTKFSILAKGYNGANNIRGSWNGLQELFLKDYPYTYYVHCLVHRLQLTLVSATRNISDINSFFSYLDNIINMITSSPKRINELKSAQRKEIEHLLEIGERESRSGANQIGNLQQARGTRWSSHYNSIKSLIDMYAATCKVLEYLSDHSPSIRSQSEVGGVYKTMTTFEFVFILHLMRRILAIVDVFCQALQKKTQNILTTMRFVRTTKTILQVLRESGWEEFLEEMMELDTRFNKTSLELLSFSMALDPKNSFESFNMNNICMLVEKFYPEAFTQRDIYSESRFQVPTLSDLCRELVARRRSESYVILTKLICFVLTLHVSTATVERAFSSMKHVKMEIRDKMDDGFLTDCLTLNIEREFSMNEFYAYIIDE